MATTTDPDVVHCFSWETGVSFELPVGFTFDDEGTGFAGWVDDPADDTEPDDHGPDPTALPTRVLVRTMRGDDRPDGAAAVLAGELAGLGGEELDRRSSTVDQAPATTVVRRRHDDRLGTEIVVHQTVVEVDDAIVTVSAVTPAEGADRRLAAFDAAVASIRFVLP